MTNQSLFKAFDVIMRTNHNLCIGISNSRNVHTIIRSSIANFNSVSLFNSLSLIFKFSKYCITIQQLIDCISYVLIRSHILILSTSKLWKFNIIFNVFTEVNSISTIFSQICFISIFTKIKSTGNSYSIFNIVNCQSFCRRLSRLNCLSSLSSSSTFRSSRRIIFLKCSTRSTNHINYSSNTHQKYYRHNNISYFLNFYLLLDKRFLIIGFLISHFSYPPKLLNIF